jgi:hypothetical protein
MTNAAEIARARARIAEIDATLATGATSSTLDGTTITYDFDALRREREELRRLLPSDRPRKQTAFNVKLG